MDNEQLKRIANALEEILQFRPYSFTLDLAVVAQRKDLVTLDAWAANLLRTEAATGDCEAFAVAVLMYIREKLLGGGGNNPARLSMGAASGTVNALSAEHAATLFRELAAIDLPSTLRDEAAILYQLCAEAKPKLQTLVNSEARFPFQQIPVPPGACASIGTFLPDVADLSSGCAEASAPVCAIPTTGLQPAVPIVSDSSLLPASNSASLAAFGSATGPAPLPGMPGGGTNVARNAGLGPRK